MKKTTKTTAAKATTKKTTKTKTCKGGKCKKYPIFRARCDGA